MKVSSKYLDRLFVGNNGSKAIVTSHWMIYHVDMITSEMRHVSEPKTAITQRLKTDNWNDVAFSDYNNFTEDVEAFNSFTDICEFTISYEALKMLADFAEINDTRYYANGVAFNNYIGIASNALTLCRHTHTNNVGEAIDLQIIPKTAIIEVLKQGKKGDHVLIRLGAFDSNYPDVDPRFEMRIRDYVVVGRCIVGKFPPYETAIDVDINLTSDFNLTSEAELEIAKKEGKVKKVEVDWNHFNQTPSYASYEYKMFKKCLKYSTGKLQCKEVERPVQFESKIENTLILQVPMRY